MKTGKDNFCGNCGKTVKNENFCMKCGYSLYSDDSEIGKPTKSKRNDKQKTLNSKGIGKKKKLLIGFGIILIILIFGGGLSSKSSNTSNTTIMINESQHIGSMIVELEKIELHGTYATIFLSVENLGPNEGHIYETDAYVIQDKTQFQMISKPLGASGKWIDGYNIPAHTIREGVIFLKLWNTNKISSFVLEGTTIKDAPFGLGGVPKDITYVFEIDPNSKCGLGTVYDDATNSCIVK